jgi:hypothetical protein
MRMSLVIFSTIAGVATIVAAADPLPPDASYRPLPTLGARGAYSADTVGPTSDELKES